MFVAPVCGCNCCGVTVGGDPVAILLAEVEAIILAEVAFGGLAVEVRSPS